MAITVVRPTRAEFRKGIARFADLQRCETGLPDMGLPGCKRAFLNVLGFSQPKGGGQYSPFGDMAPAAISHLQAGHGIAFVRARPGNGVLMHTHDTVEGFIVIDGRWILESECEDGVDRVELGPLDYIAFPVGVQRRFECVAAAPGREEGTLLGIIAGDAPAAEISPEGVEALVAAGLMEATRVTV